MVIWLAVLLVVLFGAHRMILRRLRQTAGYRTAAASRPETDQEDLK